MQKAPQKVLFVCLGNICRSPSAESIFRKKSAELKLNIEYDSAGTAAYHIGERSDPRSIKHAENRNYEMKHLARQLSVKDFDKFDIIFVMDDSNYKNVMSICPEGSRHKVQLLTDHKVKQKYNHVPDPYYGNGSDFELVLDIIEDSWLGFLKTYFPSANP